MACTAASCQVGQGRVHSVQSDKAEGRFLRCISPPISLLSHTSAGNAALISTDRSLCSNVTVYGWLLIATSHTLSHTHARAHTHTHTHTHHKLHSKVVTELAKLGQTVFWGNRGTHLSLVVLKERLSLCCGKTKRHSMHGYRMDSRQVLT